MQHNRLNTDPIHIVYRLSGSIPAADLNKLKVTYRVAKEKLRIQFPVKSLKLDTPEYKMFRAASEKIEETHFQNYETLVHQRDAGPMFLSDPAAQKIIIDSWLFIAKQRNISVYIVCVMSNHVHVIIRGNDADCDIDLALLMRDHKKFTATQINKVQGKKGQRVWADDFFDRDVRRGAFTQVLWYVLKNPVVAKMVVSPFDYSGTWFDPRLEQEYVAPYRSNWS